MKTPGRPMSPSYFGISYSKNQMVPKCVPGQIRNQAMVLVRIFAIVGEDEIGRNCLLQFLEDRFDLGSAIRHKAVPERFEDWSTQPRRVDELSCRVLGLRGTRASRAEHDPVEHAVWVLRRQPQDCTSAANLNIVGMTA